MKVSVIIPTYGEPKYLDKGIASVCSQTLKDIEVIVIDDNNPDTEARTHTEELLLRLSNADHRIRYVKHPHNLNGAVARNTGLQYATGEYIAFLDSDDEYLPTRLEKCYDAMQMAPKDIAGVYTGCEFRRQGAVYHTETNVKSGNFLLETLACTFMFCTGSNIFVRKSVVDEINGFDPGFLRHQDYEFLARVFEHYSLIALQEVLVIKNNDNINLPNVKKMIDIKKQYLDKFESVISKLSVNQQNYIYHKQYFLIAEAALRSRELAISKEYYAKAKQYGGLSIKEQMRRLAFMVLGLKKR